MSDPRLAFVYSPEIERLSYPADCPFKTQRAGLARRQMLSFGLLGGQNRAEIAARQATEAELGRYHTGRYLEELRRVAAGDLTVAGLRMGLGGADTPVFRDAYEYGAWACGAGLAGAEALLEGRHDVVFNLLGGFHHAMAERAAGFCYLNDVVLACKRLAAGGKRVLYLDVDAHHGDGVQAAFYGSRQVMTISMHESGKTLFPWGGFEDEIGEGEGRGYNVNVSLPAGTYDEAFLTALDGVVMPLVEWFDPGAVVLELGMDTLAGDPLTHLRMTNNVVVEVAERLMRFERPTLVVGGGGYHVENTVRAWTLAWRTFARENDECDFGMGMGGVMLGSSEWAGGLRDRTLPVSMEQRRDVEPQLQAAIDAVHNNVFRLHGLGTCCR